MMEFEIESIAAERVLPQTPDESHTRTGDYVSHSN
jgi:hypothetical protein